MWKWWRRVKEIAVELEIHKLGSDGAWFIRIIRFCFCLGKRPQNREFFSFFRNFYLIFQEIIQNESSRNPWLSIVNVISGEILIHLCPEKLSAHQNVELCELQYLLDELSDEVALYVARQRHSKFTQFSVWLGMACLKWCKMDSQHCLKNRWRYEIGVLCVLRYL